MTDEQEQGVERFGGQTNVLAVAQQLARGNVDPEAPEDVCLGFHQRIAGLPSANVSTVGAVLCLFSS